jgi:YggT family protein
VQILCVLISVYMIILAGRAIMSWFPIRSDSPVAGIYGLLHDLTEPVLAPLRRVIPPAGMLDLSFLILFVLLVILRNVVCSA